MFDLPEEYKMQVKIAMKDFIPKELKPEEKKRVKDAVKKVSLAYQIAGETIPSVMDKEYRCQVIQIYEIEVTNMKDASFIATMYQSIIKSLCVLRIHDTVNEVYSFALKRLNQTDDSQIVVTDAECTERFPIVLPDRRKDRFLEYLSYNRILNKTNKVNYYFEMYAKEYMLHHEKAYANMEIVINKPIWYDANRIIKIYSLLKHVVEKKENATRLINNAERVQANQEIKECLSQIDSEIQ